MEVETLYLHGCTVVATEGPFIGCTDVVVGPHGPLLKGADSRGHLLAEQKRKKKQSRTVDVEFTVNPPEPPLGYALFEEERRVPVVGVCAGCHVEGLRVGRWVS